MSTESSRKPSDLFPIKMDDIPREAAGPAPMSTFQMWRAAISRPSVELYKTIAQHPQASITTAFLWVFASIFSIDLIVGLAVLVLIFGGDPTLIPVLSVTVAPFLGYAVLLGVGVAFVFLMLIAAMQAASRLLGGQGTYQQMVHVNAAFTAPLIWITIAFIFLALPATVVFGLGIPALVSLLSLLSYGVLVTLVIYQFSLMFTAVQAVHYFRTVKALLTTGVAVLLWVLLYHALMTRLQIQERTLPALITYARGSFYLQKGDYAPAIAEYDEVIQLDLAWAEAYNNRGVAYTRQGQYEEAIADYTQALALDPQLAITYQNRALVYDQQGQSAQALADYRRYVELVGEASVPPEIRQRIAELEK